MRTACDEKNGTDPRQLRAIVDLRKAGWSPEDIRGLLGISERTLFRRLREIRDRSSRTAQRPI